MTAPEPVPLHPEATDDPRTVRWIIPLGHLTRLGVPHTWPPALAALRDAGVVTALSSAPTCVTIQLAPEHPWREHGPTVRDALTADLHQPDAWAWPAPTPLPDAAPASGEPLSASDVDLHTLTQHLLDGPTGDYIRSHGGSIELVGVRDGVVTVRLAGACATCPAAAATLHRRVEDALRRAHPDVVSVVNERTTGVRRGG